MTSISFEVQRERPRDRPGQHSTLGQYVSIPGVAALGSAALLYAYSACVSRKAQELSRAEPISQLADLSNVAHLLPMLVAIRGRVNSYYAKKCELSDKHAVIHELMEEEVWRKQHAQGRTIYEPFETRKAFEECEWFVDDGSGLRVKVENALQAGQLRSTMETKTQFSPEDFEQKSVGRMFMEKAWQMTKIGMRKTERYLPVGTVVTCVGELAPNQIRTPISSTPAGTVSPPQGSFTTSPPFHFSTTQPTPSSSSRHSSPASSSNSNPSDTNNSPNNSNPSSTSGSSLGGATGPASSGDAHPSPGSSTSTLLLQARRARQPGSSSSSSSSSNTATSSHSTAQRGTAGTGPLSGLFPGQAEHEQGGGPHAFTRADRASNSANSGSQASTSGREEGLAYVMRKPVAGPSYITTLSADQLVATLSSTARRCKWAAYALGAVGAYLVARKAFMRLLQRLHQHRVRTRVLQAENARRTRLAEAQKARSDANGWTNIGANDLSEACQLDARQDGYQDGYDGDREPNTCVICLENAVGTVFTPCGHLCCCVGCGLATSLDKCPVCRQRGRAIRVFRP